MASWVVSRILPPRKLVTNSILRSDRPACRYTGEDRLLAGGRDKHLSGNPTSQELGTATTVRVEGIAGGSIR